MDSFDDKFDSILDHIYGKGFFTGIDADDDGLPCVVFKEEGDKLWN